MPLCPSSRTCGCSLNSSSLAVTGDGSSASPWQVDILGAGNLLQYYTFATTTERDTVLPAPQEGQKCFIRATDEEHMWWPTLGWRIWNKPRVAWTTSFTPTPVPTGFNHGNAVQNAWYSIHDGRVFCETQYIIGSTTNWGGASANMTPVYSQPPGTFLAPTYTTLRQGFGSAWFLKAASAESVAGIVEVGNTGFRIYNGANDQSYSIGNATTPMQPFTWASGDSMGADWSFAQI